MLWSTVRLPLPSWRFILNSRGKYGLATFGGPPQCRVHRDASEQRHAHLTAHALSAPAAALKHVGADHQALQQLRAIRSRQAKLSLQQRHDTRSDVLSPCAASGPAWRPDSPLKLEPDEGQSLLQPAHVLDNAEDSQTNLGKTGKAGTARRGL